MVRGFLPYFPLALLALLLWKTPRREGLLAAALLGAILLQPWAGELLPSLPMNPALLPLYPAFLIFVRRIPPLAVIAAAGVATALLGLQLVGLLGSQIPDGGPHGHVRALPYSRLPLDIEEVQPGSGLLRQKQSGDPPAPVLWAPADQAFASGRELWTFGSERVEFFLESEKPLQTILLQVRSMALPNRVELRHQGGKEQYDFARGANLSQRLLHLGQGETTTRGSFIYRFEVKSDHAAKPYWSGESGEEYYVGAALAYLGTEEEVNRDLYHLTWPSCGAPPQLEAGSIALALARARNTSSFSWPIEGAAQVRIASRWLDPAGNRVAENTFRADLFEEAKPGEEIKTWLKIKAPTTPGSYQLEFDAVFENIGWFSAKGAETCRQAVEVLPRSP